MSNDSAPSDRSPFGTSRQIVRVVLPSRLGCDLERFQEIQRKIVDRLGHSMCVCGFDVRWELEERFLVDDELAIRPS